MVAAVSLHLLDPVSSQETVRQGLKAAKSALRRCQAAADVHVVSDSDTGDEEKPFHEVAEVDKRTEEGYDDAGLAPAQADGDEQKEAEAEPAPKKAKTEEEDEEVVLTHACFQTSQDPYLAVDG